MDRTTAWVKEPASKLATVAGMAALASVSLTHVAVADEHKGRAGDVRPATPQDTWKTLRDLARASALQFLSPQERALAATRQRLDLKRLREGLTPEEQTELVMAQWKLDRLDDARVGSQLDALEELALVQSDLANEMERYAAAIRDAGLPKITDRRRNRRK